MVEELAARHALAKEVIEGVTERTGAYRCSSRKLHGSYWSAVSRAAFRQSRRPCSNH
jgi:hypothetical protein